MTQTQTLTHRYTHREIHSIYECTRLLFMRSWSKFLRSKFNKSERKKIQTTSNRSSNRKTKQQNKMYGWFMYSICSCQWICSLSLVFSLSSLTYFSPSNPSFGCPTIDANWLWRFSFSAADRSFFSLARALLCFVWSTFNDVAIIALYFNFISTFQ